MAILDSADHLLGACPPVQESHVEMDGAWALYEAWVKIQMGHADTALVFGFGKSSPGELPIVLSQQLDPYYLAPLWVDTISLAAMQARQMLDQGLIVENGGNLVLSGKNKGKSWVRLNANALKNDMQIVVDSTVGWRVGDKIVISSTDYEYAQAGKGAPVTAVFNTEGITVYDPYSGPAVIYDRPV